MEDKLETFLMTALHSLPCPVSQPPGGAENETYVTFNEASGAPTRQRGQSIWCSCTLSATGRTAHTGVLFSPR